MSCGYYKVYYHSGPPPCSNAIMPFDRVTLKRKHTHMIASRARH